MILYEVCGQEGSEYVATLKEAREEVKKWHPPDTQIDRITLVDLPPKQLAVRLLSGRQFVRKRETVT